MASKFINGLECENVINTTLTDSRNCLPTTLTLLMKNVLGQGCTYLGEGPRDPVERKKKIHPKGRAWRKSLDLKQSLSHQKGMAFLVPVLYLSSDSFPSPNSLGTCVGLGQGRGHDE